MDWLTVFGALPLAWLLWTALALRRNYHAACSTNLPVILSPVGTLTIPWFLFCKLVPVTPYFEKLPRSLFTWTRFTYLGWQYHDGGRAHRELGSAFVVCSPSYNEIHLAHAEAANSCLIRRKEFIKPPMMYEPLNIFGRNLDTVEDDVWQRHRKLTAPSFNEKVSSSVWSEAIRQASQALAEWKKKRDGTRDVAGDSATLALHVLTSAGMGICYDFKDATSKPVPPHRLTYRDALVEILRNFVYLTVIPMKHMNKKFMPAKLRRVGLACEEFMLYMSEVVRQEKQATATKSERKEVNVNLLSAMVRASERDTRENGEQGISKQGLTDDELFGNLFIYNLAGHETTANTVATAIAYLAVDPMWQEWLSQEIGQVVDSTESPSNWSYEILFPKLKRCMAVMYETLRLHGSVVFIPKEANTESPTLQIDGKAHVIPSGTHVTINSHAIHCNSKIYSDPQQWRPSRWIFSKNGQEQLYEPPPGTFLAWAEGPRICPGKKFAQVEFVAVIAFLFQKHTVSPGPKDGESLQKATQRLVENINDSFISITLQMKKPKDVPLVWTEE